MRVSAVAFVFFLSICRTGHAGPQEDRALKVAKVKCALAAAALVGSIVYTRPELVVGLFGSGASSDIGEEHPSLENPNGIISPKSIFKVPEENDPPGDDFDSSFITDRSKLALVPWKEFPARSADRARTNIPGHFLEAVKEFKRFSLKNSSDEMWEALPANYKDEAWLKKKSAKELVVLASNIVQKHLSYDLVDEKIEL